MNERILQLYRQSYSDGYFGKAFDPEKFAEMIIRECSDVVNYFYSRNECASKKDILNHFGVKE